MQPRSLRRLGTAAVLAAVASPFLVAAAAHASGSSAISGSVFNDANRDGVMGAGEAPFTSQLLLLFDSAGTNIASVQTDASGRYTFSGLADGTYTVKFSTQGWWNLRSDWVPTTTGSLYFSRSVSVSGSAVADIGLRQIVRSTDVNAPLSTYSAPGGLVVKSYDDAVTAQDVYAALARGTLFGPEASTTTVFFDYGTQTDATTSVAGTDGTYSDFHANLWIAYLCWLDNYDEVMFHEYGHSWSIYNADLVQQDDSLSAYLQARGIAGDSRLYSSKAWDPREMIAEDYRQLFGSPTAANYPQANTDVPPAAQVVGLKDFLQNTFTQPPPPGSGGTTGGSTVTTSTPTETTVAITGLGVTPQPVSSAGTVAFTLSQHATVTVSIVNSAGTVVRSLLSGVGATGSVSTKWDRKDESGRRVKSGTYSVSIVATDDYGHVVTASTQFKVS